MNPLKALIDGIAESETVLNKNIDEIPAGRMAGWEIRRNSASFEIAKLKDEYKHVLSQSAIVMLTHGPDQEKFVKVAVEELKEGVVVVDGHAIYKRIAGIIAPGVIGEGRLGPNQLANLMSALRDVASELGIAEFRTPNMSIFEGLATMEQVVETVRAIVRSIEPEYFSKRAIEKTIGETALTERYCSVVVPVIVTNLDEVEIEHLSKMLYSGVRNFPVKCVNVTQKTVLATLTNIKKKLQ